MTEKESKAGFKSKNLRVEIPLLKLVEEVMKESGFPFDNYKLFADISMYYFIKICKKMMKSQNPKNIVAFKKMIENLAEEMIVNKLLDPATKKWKNKFYEKTCEECGQSFQTKRKEQKFDKQECANIFNGKQKKDKTS